MDLKHFPHDVQVCTIDFGPAVSIQEMKLSFNRIMLIKKLKLIGYLVHRISNSTIIRVVDNVEFSTLSVHITLKRSLSPYITQFYFPSALLVVLSWGAFWIPKSSCPGVDARIALILTSCLSMCVIMNGMYIILRKLFNLDI